MEHIKTILDLVSDRLSTTAHSDVVVGTPIELGSVTIVPLSRISIAIGGGGGKGEGEIMQQRHRGGMPPGKGSGGGSGGAARIRPVAIAVFSEETVEILPVPGRKGRIDRILDKVPQLMERINNFKNGTK